LLKHFFGLLPLFRGFILIPCLKKVQIYPLICLIGVELVFPMQIRGFEVRDPCEFVLDPPSMLLVNDFKKELDEEPLEFDIFAHMRI
jgi:hypothetical protein